MLDNSNIYVIEWPELKGNLKMKERKQLTQAEANFALELLREMSRNCQSWVKEMKEVNKQVSEMVDKDKPETEPLFKDMNRLRTKIRKVRDGNKRLSTIIHKLKTQR